ncbi:hypothetical protein JMN32_05525 [Fulvivirga sp. 29W222]|uniref:Uncharacterized protein n=1 Tax=Fulvivirga marina TaxID=2494733 RepID=A0A937KD12_9BACT|nr:hypothetical protein [Fulvivirga marina]MBL6445758.1 hypothetical protein [Fulvivirga marina]
MDKIDYNFNFAHNIPALTIVFSSFGVQTYFEFKGFLSRSFPEHNFLFLKDSQRSWYYKGIKGFSNSHDETLNKLRSVISEHNFQSVYTLGMCAGGYASLLYGHLLKANRIFCFSPQTLLNGSIPSRYMKHLTRINEDYKGHRYLDLSQLDLSNDTIDLFYDPNHERDQLHVSNLISKWNNTNVVGTTGGHFVAREMRDNGRLKEVLSPYLNAYV